MLQDNSAINLTVGVHSDRGRRRKTNQDRYFVSAETGVFVIADGMGGHQSGELAAEIAVAHLSQASGNASALPLDQSLQQHMVEANSAIFSRANEDEHKGMGTTAIAALVRGSDLYAAHVGDSRLYRFRRGELLQLSRDHSMLQDLIDQGFYTERDSRGTGIGHVLTRSLGTKASVISDSIHCELEAEDLLLFCSDGLSDLVADWLIVDTLTDCQGDLDASCRLLVNEANRAGGTDNVTVLLVRCGA